MSVGMNSTVIGAALLGLYYGLAMVMHSLGSDIPYPTDLLPSGWRGWM
jgi:hypothetical protein